MPRNLHAYFGTAAAAGTLSFVCLHSLRSILNRVYTDCFRCRAGFGSVLFCFLVLFFVGTIFNTGGSQHNTTPQRPIAHGSLRRATGGTDPPQSFVLPRIHFPIDTLDWCDIRERTPSRDERGICRVSYATPQSDRRLIRRVVFTENFKLSD